MIRLNDTSLLSISCNKLLYSFDFFSRGGGGSMKSAPTCILFSRNATKANSKFCNDVQLKGQLATSMNLEVVLQTSIKN